MVELTINLEADFLNHSFNEFIKLDQKSSIFRNTTDNTRFTNIAYLFLYTVHNDSSIPI